MKTIIGALILGIFLFVIAALKSESAKPTAEEIEAQQAQLLADAQETERKRLQNRYSTTGEANLATDISAFKQWTKTLSTADRQRLFDEAGKLQVYKANCGTIPAKLDHTLQVTVAAFPESVASSREYAESALRGLGKQRACGLMREAME